MAFHLVSESEYKMVTPSVVNLSGFAHKLPKLTHFIGKRATL
jgi:hypothetical protein